jgi:hypothetical protein
MQTRRFGARVVVAFLIPPLCGVASVFHEGLVSVAVGFFSDFAFRHLFSVTGCARVFAAPGIYHFSRRGNISRERAEARVRSVICGAFGRSGYAKRRDIAEISPQ